MISTADTTYTTSSEHTHHHRRRRSDSHRHEEREQRGNRLWLLPWLEVAWLLLLALPILLPGRLLDERWQPFVLVGLLALWPLQWRRLRQRWSLGRTYPMPGLLVLLLAWLPITIVVAVAPTLAWQSAGYGLLGMTCYLVLSNHPYLQEDPVRLSWGLLLLSSGLIISAPPLVQWKSAFRLFYMPLYDWFQVIQIGNGDTIHANVLAGALVLLIPVALSLCIKAQPRAYKVAIQAATEHTKIILPHNKAHHLAVLWQVAYYLLAGCMIVLLLLTQSRGGYLSFAVMLLLLIWLRWPRLTYVLPIVLAGLGFALYKADLGQIFNLLGADNTFGGADWRAPVWHASWQALQDFGWTGIGIGNFQQVMPHLYPNPAIANTAATHAHNLLLQIGLDLGLPGLVAYVIFYLTMIGRALAVLRRARSSQAVATALGATWDGHAIIAPPEVGITVSTKRFIRQLVHLERTNQYHWAIAAGCLAALVGMQIHGLLDAVTWGNKLAFIPWLIFAQITLLYHYEPDAE